MEGDSEFSKAAVAASDLCKLSWWQIYVRLHPVILELESVLRCGLVEELLIVVVLGGCE